MRLTLLPTGPGEPRTFDSPFEDWHGGMWVPDGKRFIVDAREPGHGFRGYLHNINGGAPHAITPDRIEPLLVSPDGKLVLASGPDRARSMALYPIDGGMPHTVKGLDPDDAPVQWCADPNFIFVRAPGPYPARVFRFNLQTGKKTPWRDIEPSDTAGLFWVGTSDNGRSLFITPDGRGYAYLSLRVLADLFMIDGLK